MATLKLTSSGGGVQSIDTPSTASSFTSTLPGTTGTLLDTNSSLPAANLTGTVADARISALTASKLTGALPAISGASLTGIASGGMTLLTTLSPTSGTSIVASGLNLSTYKTLQVFIYNVGNTTGGGVLRWKETGNTVVRISGTTGGAGNSTYGVLLHDLTVGVTAVIRGYALADDLTFADPGGSGPVGINTGIDTATTSITFDFSGGETFDKGTIKIYGLK